MPKRLIPILSLLLVTSLALAAPAFAEEAPHGGGGEHGGGGASFLIPDVAVAIATILVFVLLLVVLKKAAWGPILSGLQAREKGIRDAIEGAEKANADAKAMLADYTQKVGKAAEEARAILEEGRRDAEQLKARIVAEGTAEAARERERALRDIEIARQGALKDVYDQVAVVATDVAGRILGERLDPAGHRRLVDEAVGAYERTRKAPGARA